MSPPSPRAEELTDPKDVSIAPDVLVIAIAFPAAVIFPVVTF